MIKQIKYYFIPLESNLFDTPEFINSINFESIGNHSLYGSIGIKPKISHNDFEEFELEDTLQAIASFADGSEFAAKFYIVDINTNVWLNRYIGEFPKIDIDGTLKDETVGGNVTLFESQVDYKVMKLPDDTLGVCGITTDTGKDFIDTSFFDSALRKLYIMGDMTYGENIDVCTVNDLDVLEELIESPDDTLVTAVSGFNIDNIFKDVNTIEDARKKGFSPIPLGRWVLFAVRLWIYLKIPTVLPMVQRTTDELADTIVDYYKQTVAGAFNIWGSFPQNNPGEQGMRNILKVVFRMMYYTREPHLMKLVDPLMKLAITIYWFGATTQLIPPPGAVQNIASPVIFPGVPFIQLPTPNLDSTQMARELAFMFTIHSLTIFGIETGLVPAGPSLVPAPYPWVALI